MINERGFWGKEEAETMHMFDPVLCEKIISACRPYETIIDVGCGNGAYVFALDKAGYSVVGYDGSPSTPEITKGRCMVMDFSNPVDMGLYDVVLSLEIGEYIPRQYESVFIDNITSAARHMLILSWAIEGQGGTGHVNCRNNDYIIEAVEAKGLVFDPELSAELRQGVFLPWFANTIMIFKK
jgi:SAM-dependent methyltransferase